MLTHLVFFAGKNLESCLLRFRVLTQLLGMEMRGEKMVYHADFMKKSLKGPVHLFIVNFAEFTIISNGKGSNGPYQNRFPIAIPHSRSK